MELDPIILAKISQDAGVKEGQARATVALLEEQATVPFIARYRKEATGNLDEVAIRDIADRLEYYKDLLARRETILKSIEEQGHLTEELKKQISNCFEKNVLEDLYLPYKPKRKTKASVAMERGLEPLGKFIWEQVPGEKSLEELADTFINAEKEVMTREAALEGALHIVAEWISEDAEIRREVRELMMRDGLVVSKAVKGKEEEKTKFEMYYDFKEPVPKIPSHRMLAIRRGVKEQILSFSIEIESDKVLALITTRVLKDAESPFASFLKNAINDSYNRLLNPSIQSEVRSYLKEKSDTEAIKVFDANLTNLLLSPPAGPIMVVGIDPGFRTGCKLAVVDETGKFLEHATIYPTEPKKNVAIAERTLLNLVQKYHVKAIDIGNGTASRETDSFVRSFLRKYQTGEPFEFEAASKGAVQSVPATIVEETIPVPEASVQSAAEANGKSEESMAAAPFECSATMVAEESRETLAAGGVPEEERPADETVLLESPATEAVDQGPEVSPRPSEEVEGRSAVPDDHHSIFSVIVNESGASVYSASDLARKEFPDLDVTVRGAISIARRLQDPLAELVKIHPKSIGVGQYQHDVDQNRLREGLEASVESCVNRVGVDINTASLELLKYISGLNQRAAKRIIEFRNQNGRFSSRQQLLQVPGFGEKTFEQAAGFLRVKGGGNPLDDTAVHPESYAVVERMAAALNVAIAELVGNTQLLEKLDIKQFVDEKTGEFTLNDIREELLKPGRDPRSQFIVPTFRDDVKEVSDLKDGMELEGTVTNVTNFGAFVDIGVHQDGLVHVSEISNRFVQDPRAAVQVGQIVKVKVIGVDQAMKRISLSIKALMPKIKKTKIRKAKKLPSRPQAQASVENLQTAPAAKAGEARKTRESRPGSFPSRQSHDQVRSERPARQEAPAIPTKGAKPASPRKESQIGAPNLSFEDKIRMLQEKFGGIR